MHHKGWRKGVHWGVRLVEFLVVLGYIAFCSAVVVIAAVVYFIASIRDRLWDNDTQGDQCG